MIEVSNPFPVAVTDMVVEIAVIEVATVSDRVDKARNFRPAVWLRERDLTFRQGIAVRRDHEGLLLRASGSCPGPDDEAGEMPTV
ncbi:hypothetical protein [Sphingomonas sp. R86520]|uniref:hypothetical protein n=1 Tax=Sphingomonas sp. R86520 TaxID=3093859 RepID=UPI0036D3E1D6